MFLLKVFIEIKRRKMYSLVNRHGYSANQTVKCSQQLDKLLNILRKMEERKAYS